MSDFVIWLIGFAIGGFVGVILGGAAMVMSQNKKK